MANWETIIESFYKQHRHWNSARIDRLILEVLSEDEGGNVIEIPPEGVDFSGAASSAEGAEELLVYGLNHHKELAGKQFKFNQDFLKVLNSSPMKKLSEEANINLVKIGVACGQAGGVSGAQRFGGESLQALAGMNGTPKTDILIDDMRVSVKDADAGYQAEAVEANTFSSIFNYALEQYKAGAGADKEYVKELDSNKVSNLMIGVLDGYRRGEESGGAINTLLGLKGGKGEEAAAQSREELSGLSGELEDAAFNELLDSMSSLFKDSLFKREFIKQAITGQYKFPEGSEGVATHILYFSPSGVKFEVLKLSEDYITEVSNKFTWQIRTGRRRASKQSAEKSYGKLQKGPVADKINAVATALGLSPEDVVGEFKSRGLLLKSGEEINQFNYELLRALANQTKSKSFQATDFDMLFSSVWEKFIKKSDVIEVDGEYMFKGRSGRFGTDMAGKKYELDDSGNVVWLNSDTGEEASPKTAKEKKDLKNRGFEPKPYLKNTFVREQLDEGWFGDAFKKIKNVAGDSLEKIKKMLSSSGSKLLSLLGFDVGRHEVPTVVPTLSNKFEK